jgi:hypothetical protein
MSELGEMYAEWKKEKQEKKIANHDNSIELLKEKKVPFKMFSNDHLRVGEYDFWPSTGLFIHLKTKKRGRGVFNLLKKIGADHVE